MIHRRYTPLGNRIAELGSSQRELAKIMKLSQQTISKKMRGEVTVAVSDLEMLAKHFKVPMTYFFEVEGMDGSTLKNFRAMVELRPQAVDVILDAFRIDPDIITQLAAAAAPLIQAGLSGKPIKRGKR